MSVKLQFGGALRLATTASAPTHSAPLRCGVQELDSRHQEAFRTLQYALVYLERGDGEYRTAVGDTYRLTAGSVFQRFPGQPHFVSYHGPACQCYLALPAQCGEIMQLTGVVDPARPVFELADTADLLDRWLALRDRLRDAPEAELPEVLLQMQSFALELHRRAASQRLPPPRWLTEARRRLGADFEQPLRLPELARELGLGYSRFRQQFHRLTGVSPGEYRLARRLERAMSLLGQEELRLKEIASRLGFHDEFAFSAQFKRLSGQSPTAFRRQNH